MERFTDIYKGRYGIKTPEGIMPAYEMASGDKAAESIIDFQKGIDRLADYENTGFEPEQIIEMDWIYAGEINAEMAADIDQAIEYFKDELSQMDIFSDIVSFREVERRSIETALKVLQRIQEESQTGQQDDGGKAAGSVRHRTDNNAVIMAAT